MKNDIGNGSQETRIQVSHVADGDLVLQIRRAIDRKRDRLDWVRVPLALVPDLASEMREAVNGARSPRAANDDRCASEGEPLFEISGRELAARAPVEHQ